MSNENSKLDSERAAFAREDRYIVLKRKHLANLPDQLQHRLKPALDEAAQLMPTMECVVVESDWPEYEKVWQMIEARATGASLPAAGSAGEEPTPVMIQAACAAFRMDVSPMQAMQAALRAALSAQQSAPELHQSVQELKNFRGEK